MKRYFSLIGLCVLVAPASLAEMRLVPMSPSVLEQRQAFNDYEIDAVFTGLPLNEVLKNIGNPSDRLEMDKGLESESVDLVWKGSRQGLLSELARKHQFNWFYGEGVLRVFTSHWQTRSLASGLVVKTELVFSAPAGSDAANVAKELAFKAGYLVQADIEQLSPLSHSFYMRGEAKDILDTYLTHIESAQPIEVHLDGIRGVVRLSKKNKGN